jgi:excinuclease UvrABC nuclease subunit
MKFHQAPRCSALCCSQEREAAQRAAELASRALAAEKRLVEAMKDEAAASAELLEAERAAKFAAQVTAVGLDSMRADNTMCYANAVRPV